MALILGARLGPYEIISALGAGGMGEVYHARDTKLGRDVALKILPEAFATHPDRLERFHREARTLASLNHPNIASLHGVEEANPSTGSGQAVLALVMELVEGEDLAQRIARGAIPVDEALVIAQQIALALEAAHEQGTIHRDLKPANIKVRSDGMVKVLDFGLAKALAPEPTTGDQPQPSTITSPAMLTGVGVILGTAAYMAPEQATGRPADKRSDVWAFGCVLYEMLTGRRAFGGEGVPDILANVLKAEPDWSALPTTVPDSVRLLLRRCLTKDRKRRLDSAVAARLEIDDALTLPAPDQHPWSATGSSIGWRRVAAFIMTALVVGGAAVGTTVWLATRPAPLRVIRTAILTSGATALNASFVGAPYLTLTPDGSRVVYRGAGQILVRALDQLEPTALTGLGVPGGQFISPDGQSVGFFDASTSLKRVAISGGAAITLAPLDGLPRGATWGADGTIVFATSTLSTGLQQVSASGGEVAVLTTPDRSRGEADHVWPQFLPAGRAVLFTITAVSGGPSASQIAVRDLRTGTETVLLRGGSHARYVPTGHLVYGDGGTLRAVAFDLSRLAITGAPVAVLAPVAMNSAGNVEVEVANNGTLAYLRSGTFDALAQRTLVWVDRQGLEVPLAAPPRPYQHPRVSPDNTRVALFSADEEQDLWVWDLARKTLTRLTSDSTIDQAPLWTLDSRQLLFSSSRGGAFNLYIQRADGTGSATRLTDSPFPQFPTGITPDGTRVVFVETPPQSGAGPAHADPHADTASGAARRDALRRA